MSVADKGFTAEEKLLNIIEHGQTAKAGAAAAPSPRGSALSRLVSRAMNKERLQKLLTLRAVNWILVAVCALATLFWIFDFLYTQKTVNARKEAAGAAEVYGNSAEPAQKKGLLGSAPVLSELVFESNRRNIFALQQEEKPVESAGAAEYESLVKNYKLVGIFWSETVPQAMVENAQDGKTTLLSEKDALGEFIVKKIFSDKVVLGKDAQEWEMR